MLKYMDASVSGITVPPEMITRMAKVKEAAGDDKKKMKELQEAEGSDRRRARAPGPGDPGIRGVHLQAIEWESAMEGIVKAPASTPPDFSGSLTAVIARTICARKETS